MGEGINEYMHVCVKHITTVMMGHLAKCWVSAHALVSVSTLVSTEHDCSHCILSVDWGESDDDSKDDLLLKPH